MTGPRLTTYTWGEVWRRRVLLLHGSTSSASTWWKVGPALAERGWSVIAVDLPAHGRSPAAGGPLVPNRAAAAVTATVDGASFDLVVGHSFGAAVAVILLAGDRPIAARAVLEELPGPHSVDWIAEAASISGAAASAQAEPAAMTGQIRATQVRWADQDCQHAVTGLAVCEPAEIAEGLTRGRDWTPPSVMFRVSVPITLLLAPDAPGINRLEDATVLRGADRTAAVNALRAEVRIVDAGHCIHRDNPHAWLTTADPP